jgi:hypothetical protein
MNPFSYENAAKEQRKPRRACCGLLLARLLCADFHSITKESTMRASLSLIAAATLALTSCGGGQTASQLQEGWDRPNAPAQLTRTYVARLGDLPLAGRAGVTPWADTYWPNSRRGLAWRWQAGQSVATMPSRDQLARMSQGELNALSPAEKYDILAGNYGYTLTRGELGRTNPSHAAWWGLCHGWAQASYLFREPRSIVATSADGLRIPFASSDIKALLTYFQQYKRPKSTINFLGLRCNSGQPGVSRECRDVNAGSFHIILANLIGRNRQVVVGDLFNGDQVWNYPIFEYQSRVTSENTPRYPSAAPGTVQIKTIVTQVRHASLVRPDSRPHGMNSNVTATKTFSYTVELNAAGHIIGGEWVSVERPDFLWRQTAPIFNGYFTQLGNLYSAAAQ